MMLVKNSTVLYLLVALHLAHADVFTVSNTLNVGDGSLRWAIEQAETQAGPDTIVFALSPDDSGWDPIIGAWEITLIDKLPDFLDGGTFIDGSSQAQFGGDTNQQGPEICIYASEAPSSSALFTIRSANNKFYALAIAGLPNFIFKLEGTSAHHNIFQGLYLNLDATGSETYRVELSQGIWLRKGAHDNIIGGTTTMERNILSGFWGRAIVLEGAHHNIIKGNYIGVKKNGLDPAGNGWTSEWEAYPTRTRISAYEGILLFLASRGNQIGGLEPGAGNVISANLRTGLRIESTGSDSNVVQANYIGVAADGKTPLSNGEAGLWLSGDPASPTHGQGPAYNLIQANVVSGNFSSGIQMRYASHYNQIKENFIGVNADGTIAVPNAHNGIYFFGQTDRGYPQYNEVGPNNIIFVNAMETALQPVTAVRLDDTQTSYNRIFGNHLGCNPQGTLHSSYNSGVFVCKGANHNTIGPDNVISGKTYGVWMRHDSTLCNIITRNRIIDTESLPIYLEAGANNDLTAPALLSADQNSITGTSIPLGWIELFIGSQNHLETFLAQVRADQDGSFQWQGVIGDGWATATVRDDTGNTSMAAEGRPIIVSAAFLGDVNNDGTVTSTDALIVLSCDVAINVAQFCPMNCGDVNGDGFVDSTDALIILSFDVGLEVPFVLGGAECSGGVTPCPGCE